MKKVLSLGLATALAVGALSGCGGGGKKGRGEDHLRYQICKITFDLLRGPGAFVRGK